MDVQCCPGAAKCTRHVCLCAAATPSACLPVELVAQPVAQRPREVGAGAAGALEGRRTAASANCLSRCLRGCFPHRHSARLRPQRRHPQDEEAERTHQHQIPVFGGTLPHACSLTGGGVGRDREGLAEPNCCRRRRRQQAATARAAGSPGRLMASESASPGPRWAWRLLPAIRAAVCDVLNGPSVGAPR